MSGLQAWLRGKTFLKIKFILHTKPVKSPLDLVLFALF
jgi:hypothetical protein